MRFQVPQFIDVEDKIFGPLTLKQFIYLAGGAGLSFVIYRFIPIKIVAIFLILPVVALSLALAFYKMNGKPFISIIESAFKFTLGSRIYVWRKEEKKIEPKKDLPKTQASQTNVPKLTESKLRDLTWSLDISDTLNRPR